MTEPRGRSERPFGAALVAASIVLLVMAWVIAVGDPVPRVGGDARQYLLLAENLVEGHGLSLSREAPYEPTAIRGPGYPLFLLLSTAGLRLPLESVVVVQAILQAILAGLLAWLLTRTGVRPLLAGVAGVGAGLLPPSAGAALTLLTENLATFLGTGAGVAVALGVLQAEEGGEGVSVGPWIVGGLLAGFGVLVRPEILAVVLLLGAVAGVTFGRRGRKILRAALLLGAAGLVVLPWGIRNQLRLDRPVVTAATWDWVPPGYARWVQTWMDHPRYVQGAYWDVWPFGRYDPSAFPARAFADPQERALVDSLLTRYAGPELTGSSADSVMGALARKRMRERPFQTLVVVPLRRIGNTVAHLPTAYAHPDSPLKVGAPADLRQALSSRYLVLEGAVAVNLLLFLGGTLGCVVACLPGFRWALPFALLFAFRLGLVGWVIHPEPRYLFPALSPAVLLSVLALHRVSR